MRRGSAASQTAAFENTQTKGHAKNETLAYRMDATATGEHTTDAFVADTPHEAIAQWAADSHCNAQMLINEQAANFDPGEVTPFHMACS
jgi:hypothetical protein